MTNKMKLKIGKSYKIVFDVKGHTLTFRCKIDDVDEFFVSFTDKFSKQITYNLKNIISFEEIEDDVCV